ncbi:MAG: hypothetical protein ACXWPM_08475 [Bdellovibrionota bacterium]
MRHSLNKVRSLIFPRNTKPMGVQKIECNICHRVFRATSRYHRFCRTCKEQNETFRFGEWILPNATFGF